MKHIFKKNQVIITVLAVMIAAAGYLNYSGKLLEKEADTMTASDDTVLLTAKDETEAANTGTYVDIMSMDGEGSEEVSAADVTEEGAGTTTAPGEAVLASVSAGDTLIAQAKLNREQIRAKNKETLLEVINNENVAEEQKQTAAANMTALADAAEREAAAELLLEAKGYTDSVVSLTEGTADVVVNLAELDEAQRAQIEDIVKRKTEVTGENIIITPRSPEA
ncbi:MAG: SpoIIIAH-like family protein [Lachnospiraceae bacterium]|nr:SpoIIIAH-like family protein [Lachnospiraceae bacterium]MDD3797442.1 SpoIIIAH-like family protein [Lachnospiraceae bacterium]